MTPVELRSRLTLTVPEAGAVLGIGRAAAYAAARRGDLPTLQLGRSLRVPVPKLLELVGLTQTPDSTRGAAAAATPLASIHALSRESGAPE